MKESEQRQIFDEWLQSYQSLLFKVVRAYAYTVNDQDDLFQDIALQVWNSIPNFQAKSAVSTWLYRVALNTALLWLRKEKKHKAVLEKQPQILQLRAEAQDERLDWLYEEIAKLQELDRMLTVLMLDGYSYKEMAQMLGISEANVGVRIHRIKKYLTKRAQNYDYYGV